MPLNDFFGPLNTTERSVLAYRFGLCDLDPRTQVEIGEILNMPHQRVSQIEKRSLVKTKRHLEAHGLGLYDFI